jgi:hypothetical protein
MNEAWSDIANAAKPATPWNGEDIDALVLLEPIGPLQPQPLHLVSSRIFYRRVDGRPFRRRTPLTSDAR